MLIGYARIFTDDQYLDLQRDALNHAACERIFKTVSMVRRRNVNDWSR